MIPNTWAPEAPHSAAPGSQEPHPGPDSVDSKEDYSIFHTCLCVCYRFIEICFSSSYVWQSRSELVCCMKSTTDILYLSACDRKFYGNSVNLLFLRSLLVE